jgi:hypothetical protein
MGLIPGAFTPTTGEARFKAWMGALESRMVTLETQQRLFNASIKGGAIVAYDDNLNQIVRLGVGGYNTTSGDITANVLSVTNNSGEFHLLIDNARGIIRPAWPLQWSKEDNFNVTPGMGSPSCWKITTTIACKVLVQDIVVFHNGGAVGEVWLDLDGLYQTHHASVSNPAGDTVSFKWDISSLGYAFGQNAILRVYAHITNGIGSFDIPQPDGGFMAILEDYPTADVNGDV